MRPPQPPDAASAETRSEIDWDAVRAWDEDYYLHVFVTEDEYEHRAVGRTDGDEIELADGTRLLDFTSGLLCVNAGQRNERIRLAIREALDRYGYVWEGYATDLRARAAKLIVEDLLGPDDWAGRVRFTSSGSEAVELALLVAKLVTGRPNLISREFAYHGWTHGALSLMGLPGSRGILAAADSGEIRRPPGIPMPGVHFAPSPYCYRCPVGPGYDECEHASTRRAIDATEDLIRTLGADSVAAVVAEPIFGVGMIHPPRDYLPALRELTHDYGILLVLDEVMTGFARTGKWFAYQHHEGVTPDMLVIGKGLVSAALPAGGLVVSRDIAERMGRWRWETVSTFAGHPLVMAATVANIEWLLEESAPERAAELGAYLGERLEELVHRHPSVAKVSGAGLLWAVELRKPDGSGERFVPLDRHTIPAGDQFWPSLFIAAECAERGVALATAPPNTLRLGPSLAASPEVVDRGVEALSGALSELDKRS